MPSTRVVLVGVGDICAHKIRIGCRGWYRHNSFRNGGGWVVGCDDWPCRQTRRASSLLLTQKNNTSSSSDFETLVLTKSLWLFLVRYQVKRTSTIRIPRIPNHYSSSLLKRMRTNIHYTKTHTHTFSRVMARGFENLPLCVQSVQPGMATCV